MSAPSTKVERILDKLRASIADGQTYEAHQMYRSLYFRYSNARQLDECYALLVDGTRRFAAAGQFASAVDLAELLIDLFRKYERVDAVRDKIDGLFDLLVALPRAEKSTAVSDGDTKSTRPSRDRFVAQLVEWSKTASDATATIDRRHGHSRVHLLLANVAVQDGRADVARTHWTFAAKEMPQVSTLQS